MEINFSSLSLGLNVISYPNSSPEVQPLSPAQGTDHPQVHGSASNVISVTGSVQN